MIDRRIVFGALAGLVFLASLTAVALHSQRVLVAGLSEPVRCRDYSDAMQKALTLSLDSGGSIVPVLGTGSMAPWIPPAAPGRDPAKTTVALVLTKRGATFDDITAGTPCIYRYSAGYLLHGAARKADGAWVMSGLHNERSDLWMTREAFVGIVAVLFVWPQ